MSKSNKKEHKIVALLVLDTIFCLIEAITGYTVHSLALVADAFHMLNDIFSLVIALWAVNVAKNRSADADYTYGWQRAEILGALINAVFLLALCLTIFIEAIQRFISPEVISNPKLILFVGVAGLCSNFIGLVLFHEHEGHGHSHGFSPDSERDEEQSVGLLHPHDSSYGSIEYDHDQAHSTETSSSSDVVLPEQVVTATLNINSNSKSSTPEHSHSHFEGAEDAHAHGHGKSLNMEGVFLHVLGDALGNVGVIVSALLIWKTNYSWKYYFDPLVSLFITAIIFTTALPLCRSASKILLQATPATISADKVQRKVLTIPGVVSVHDLHIWNLTEKITIASLHAELNVGPEKFVEVVDRIRSTLHQYGIQSVTVQPEFISIISSAYANNNNSSTSNKSNTDLHNNHHDESFISNSDVASPNPIDTNNSNNRLYGAVSNCSSGFLNNKK